MGVAHAVTFDATWNGGAGNWNVGANWSGGVAPNNSGGNTYNVFIDGGNAASSDVTLDISPTIDKLTVDAGDQLQFSNPLVRAIVQPH